MVQFILIYFTFFLLQPINIIIGFICRLMYHPPKLSKSFDNYKESIISIKTLKEMYDESISKLNIRHLKTCQDFGKFGSMLYWATNDEEMWKLVMSLVDVEHKTLHRYVPDYVKESEWTFSGDQLSGFMGALIHRIKTNGLTKEEQNKLSIIWENCSFKGFPMLIPHYTKGKKFDRGFIWRPWNFWASSSLIKMIAWCLLGYEITGKRKYLLIYYATITLFLPTLLISSIDGNIFIGKYFAMSANTSHSTMLDVTVWHIIKNNWINKHLFNRIYNERKKWSPDCLALYNRYFNKLSNKEEIFLTNLVYSTFNKFNENLEYDTEYVNLISFPQQKEQGFSEILLPGLRNSDYTDERLFVEKTWFWGNKKPEETLYDVIFPSGIY